MLAHDFEHFRAHQLATHLADLPVELVDPPDPISEQPEAAPTGAGVTEPSEVRRLVDQTTTTALEMILQDRTALHEVTPAVVHAAAASRLFDPDDDGGLGAHMSRASRLAEIWHRDNRYTPLALDPIYLAQEQLLSDRLPWDMPVPNYDEAGSPIRAGQDGRGISSYSSVSAQDAAIRFWAFHPDPIAVRRRARHLQSIIVDKFSDSCRYPDGRQVRIAGIAGGAAWPDVQAVCELTNIRPGLVIELDVFDFDLAAIELGIKRTVDALGHDALVRRDGTETAISHGNVKVRFFLQDITDQAGMAAHARGTAPRDCGYDLVEAIGIMEYFEDAGAMALIQGMDSLLADQGGEGVVANMTAYHDYVQILGVIGWRLLRPRTIEELFALTGAVPDANWTTELIRDSTPHGDTASYAFLTWGSSPVQA